VAKVILIGLLLIVPIAHAADDSVSLSVKNENIGMVHLIAPKDWEPIERHHINFGTTFYRLVPPKRAFDLELLFNDLEVGPVFRHF
jgi:hypothetical protein